MRFQTIRILRSRRKEYLADLAGSVVPTVNAVEYARLVSDLAERRRLLDGLGKITQELKLSNLTARPIDEIKSELMAAADAVGRSDFARTKREVMDS